MATLTIKTPSLSQLKDYAWRIFFTFLSAFIGGVGAGQIWNLTTVRAAALAGFAAVVNLVSFPVRNLVPFLPNVGPVTPPSSSVTVATPAPVPAPGMPPRTPPVTPQAL